MKRLLLRTQTPPTAALKSLQIQQLTCDVPLGIRDINTPAVNCAAYLINSIS